MHQIQHRLHFLGEKDSNCPHQRHDPPGKPQRKENAAQDWLWRAPEVGKAVVRGKQHHHQPMEICQRQWGDWALSQDGEWCLYSPDVPCPEQSRRKSAHKESQGYWWSPNASLVLIEADLTQFYVWITYLTIDCYDQFWKSSTLIIHYCWCWVIWICETSIS